MSSRMNEFKPLMKIGKYSMAEWLIINFRQMGIKDIVFVSGYNADLLEEQFKKWNISFIQNEKYESTQMLDSVKIGLAFMQDKCNKVIITPVDAPLVEPSTIKKIMKADEEIVIPTCHGKKGHPILLGTHVASEVLCYAGDNGLKGAIEKSKYNVCYIETNDEAILNDIDTREDYRQVLKMYSQRQSKGCVLPSQFQITAIWEQYQVPDHIRNHMQAVTKLAMEMEENLRRAGIILNQKLIYAGAMLHDLCRTAPKHEEKAADELKILGYPDLAELIKAHHTGAEDIGILTETALVFLADKMVLGASRVTIEERFAASLYKCSTKEAQIIHENRKEKAIKVYHNYLKLIDPFF